jgi:hypothetical protein
MSNDEDESTILSKLRIYFPDGLGSNGYTTNYAKISVLKRFKINAYSSTDVKLNLEWSVDGINPDMIQEINISANKWYNEKLRILMSYVRFNVVHTTDKENSCFKLIAFSPDDEGLAAAKPKPKKPLFSMKKDNSSNSSSIVSPKKEKIIRDERIPHLIFKGGLLVGKDGRNVSILPKGNEGEILMIVNGAPSWVPVSKLIRNVEGEDNSQPLPQPDESFVVKHEIYSPLNDNSIVHDGIYDISVSQPVSYSSQSSPKPHADLYEMTYESSPAPPPPRKTAERRGSGLGNALSSGISALTRSKSASKKPPAFE